MENPWTPGPWELFEATEHHGAYVAGPDGDICDFYTMSDPCGETRKPFSFHNADANARLMAAAPELAEAAEEILAYATMDDFLNGRSNESMVFGITKKDLLRLRAALAKARGEPPCAP
jgi:hypothetical protein